MNIVHKLALAATLLAPAALALPPVAIAGQTTRTDPSATAAIAAAIANPGRTAANVARDPYRHPAQTLAFFGVKPDQTVAEYMPAGGWYSEILAPLLRDHGQFIGLQPAGQGFDRLRAKLDADPALYGKARLVVWPVGDAVAPASVDIVLTFRNVHNMVMGNVTDQSFAAFYTMLKPGGTLGIVDHRLPEDKDAAREKTSGYLKVSTVRALAEKAGFVFEAASEINANPKDSADWPKGVWTLPPILANGAVDRDTYLAVGESDRMTLRFRKPATK